MDAQLEAGARRGGGKLVLKASEALRALILDGHYKPGDKLPSEAQLTRDLSVSRTVIREAIASLRADGMVEPRQGAGVFVLSPPALPFQNVDPARVSSMLEILEIRTPMEVEAAGLAALRRSPAQEEGILVSHKNIRACIEAGQATSQADFQFHLSIAAATNNPRFREFLLAIGSDMIPRAALQTDTADKSSAGYLDQLHEEHGRVVAAISDGDMEGAREAMAQHLKGAQKRYRALLRTPAPNT